ncbi:MAG: hypothetical protein WBF79_08015 [Rhodococcus sp. (in: high G+C Gram-positive bacteria)]
MGGFRDVGSEFATQVLGPASCNCGDEECVGGSYYCENRQFDHDELLGRVIRRGDG